MIPQPVVDEVRARADLVEIIGEHVSLKRAGKEFRALCPFHHEKTPSFYVVPAKGFYKCFGCGESGDAFTFLMKRHGISFHDAVRQVAGRVGVEIPETDSGRSEEDPNRGLYEAIAFAADFYQQQLWDGPTGERARAYLNTRDLSRATAERFGLGYAPEGWRSLREAAHHHGISDDVLLAAGLIKASEKSEEPYDRLRERLVFPIADLGGRWVGFGGRVIGRASDGVPKYLNSPETAIYHKGRMLYGLNWSRNAIRREKAALIVEGYMDYVSLVAHGVEHVVAGLGTAMTEEQAQLLARYTRQASLLYDSDRAGLIATFRTGDALLRAGVEPLVVPLPAGEDPDSVVRKGGADALAVHLAKAVDVLDRKLQILQERKFFEDIEGVRRALDHLLPTLRAAADPALKDIYVARVADRTGVRRETIERELTNEGRASWNRRRGLEPRSAPARAASPARAPQRARSEEYLLILLLIRDPERIANAAAQLSADEFDDQEYRELFQAMVEQGALPQEPPADWGLSARARKALVDLRADPQAILDGDRTFDDCVRDIKRRDYVAWRDRLKRRRASAQDPDELATLDRQLDTIRQSLADLAKDDNPGRTYKGSSRWTARSRQSPPLREE